MPRRKDWITHWSLIADRREQIAVGRGRECWDNAGLRERRGYAASRKGLAALSDRNIVTERDARDRGRDATGIRNRYFVFRMARTLNP
jgi:hypothetical protein